MDSCCWSTDLRITKLVESVYRLLLGAEKSSSENCSIIKVNNEGLSKYGDLCFLNNLDTWKKLFPNCFKSVSTCRNVLEYYLARNEIEFEEDKSTETAFQSIIQASSDWPLSIQKCALRNERVCLFLDRKKTAAEVVSSIVARDISYGRCEPRDESFYFNIVDDKDSELTSLRLRLIKGVAENIVQTHGYKISENTTADKYDVTTKSKGGSNNPSKILLCGVATNFATKTKETTLTEIRYSDEKLAELVDTTEHKLPSCDGRNKDHDLFLTRIVQAAIALEFLAVKPSRALTIASDHGTANAKGSSFVLYNTARISAIFQRFDEERLTGNYPSLPKIEDINFSLLDQEEEWELTYNFLLGYPEVIKTCLRLDGDLEICPQYICSFLSRLCNKFSAYYRRVRILTEGRDHLLPTMMARLYLLKAVQIVTRNALRLLNIDPVSRM